MSTPALATRRTTAHPCAGQQWNLQQARRQPLFPAGQLAAPQLRQWLAWRQLWPLSSWRQRLAASMSRRVARAGSNRRLRRSVRMR